MIKIQTYVFCCKNAGKFRKQYSNQIYAKMENILKNEKNPWTNFRMVRTFVQNLAH